MSKLPIVDADRGAAQREANAIYLANSDVLCEQDHEIIEAGLVQAFARHRIAAETKAATTITELVSALEEAQEGFRFIRNASSFASARLQASSGLKAARTALSNTRGDKNEQE